VFGICVGAASGGRFVSYGRRRLLIIAALIGIPGVALTLYVNLYALLAGRVIFGLSCGLMTVAGPRMVEEYVPPHLYSTLAPFFTIAGPFGAFICLLGGLLLPPDGASQSQLDANTTWRYIFGFPIVVQVLLLI
jgi:MFS family permease